MKCVFETTYIKVCVGHFKSGVVLLQNAGGCRHSHQERHSEHSSTVKYTGQCAVDLKKSAVLHL